MKFSIVTPSFNQAEFLEHALDSIWQQSGDFELEHIVADAGSTDGSVEILKQYAERLERGDFVPRCNNLTFHWWSRPDKGQSDALNQGFQQASGDIVGWINSDDCFASASALQAADEAFRKSGVDLIVGNARHIDESGDTIPLFTLVNQMSDAEFQEHLPRLKRYNFIIQPSCLFRRSVWEELRINPDYHFMMDWDLWLRSYNKNFQFHKIDQEVRCNRIHGSAKTTVGGEQRFAEALEVFRENRSWCLNRFYYYVYWLILRANHSPLVAPVLKPLTVFGKRVRNFLIERFRLF